MERFSESFIVCPYCGFYFDDHDLERCARRAGLSCPRCGGAITVKSTDGRHITISFSLARSEHSLANVAIPGV